MASARKLAPVDERRPAGAGRVPSGRSPASASDVAQSGASQPREQRLVRRQPRPVEGARAVAGAASEHARPFPYVSLDRLDHLEHRDFGGRAAETVAAASTRRRLDQPRAAKASEHLRERPRRHARRGGDLAALASSSGWPASSTAARIPYLPCFVSPSRMTSATLVPNVGERVVNLDQIPCDGVELASPQLRQG